MITIAGHITSGPGVASRALALQLQLIAQEFPEVAHCHCGTLNLKLEVPLLVLTPDHRTRPLAWQPGHRAAEVFDLVRVQLEAPTGAELVRAWLYIAHASPHRATPHVHEFVAPRFDLRGARDCRITLHRNGFQQPWPAFPLVVVA